MQHLTLDTHTLVKRCIELFMFINPYLKRSTIHNFVSKVLMFCYNDSLNFHNKYHVYEVLEIATKLCEYTDLSIMSKTYVQIAALCHDANHKGKPNFAESNEYRTWSLGILFDDFTQISSSTSYNEYVHLTKTLEMMDMFKIMSIYDLGRTNHADIQIFPTKKNKGYFQQRVADVRLSSNQNYKKVLCSLIMSTDLSVHAQYIEFIKRNIPTDGFDISTMLLILKLSDVSHPMRPFNVHWGWVGKLLTEGNVKYDSLQFIANDTIQFINKFVKPMVDIFKSKFPQSTSSMLFQNLENNINIWKTYNVAT